MPTVVISYCQVHRPSP